MGRLATFSANVLTGFYDCWPGAGTQRRGRPHSVRNRTRSRLGGSAKIACFPFNRTSPPLVWVAASNGAVPAKSVCGGTDLQGEPLYVSRISLPSGTTPGKLAASHGGSFASYGGLEISRMDYEVLTNPSGRAMTWQPFGSIPLSGAVLGGHDNIAGDLYVARVRRSDGMMVPAKASFKYRHCYAPYRGEEQSYSTGCDILMQ
eukprot:Em0010g427a